MTVENNQNASENTETGDHVYENEWMIRPCKAYIEEYKDCRGIKGRLHQYFIYGKTIDCSQWKRDHDNCMKFQDQKDVKAGNELVKSETERRLSRLRGHYNNTVWEKRDKPPEDWNKPLPDYITKDYENTYLYKKCQEDENQKIREQDPDNSSLCVIS